MTLPSGTDWDLSYDESALHAGAQIKTTVPLVVMRNMDYSLRRSRILMTALWYEAQGPVGTYGTLFSGECVGPNVLGSGISANIAATVWITSDVTATGTVRVYNASYGTLSYTVSGAYDGWSPWMSGTFTTPGDDTIWSFTVDSQEPTGILVVRGVALFY